MNLTFDRYIKKGFGKHFINYISLPMANLILCAIPIDLLFNSFVISNFPPFSDHATLARQMLAKLFWTPPWALDVAV